MSAISAYLLAARPRTLPAAAAPVVVGSAAAWHNGHFSLLPALAALAGALFIQVGANFANDYSDFKKGADTDERLGPTRATQSGLLTARQVIMGAVIMFALASLAGVYLLLVGGWPVAAIGIASILAAVTYVGGPLPYGYRGMGELFVFLFFGLAAVVGTYYVQAKSVAPLAWAAAIPMGLLSTAILVVNNLRDIDTDAKASKRTLAVVFGAKFAVVEYRVAVTVAFLVPVALAMAQETSPWPLITLLAFPQGVSLMRRVGTERGRPLNATLADTARLELVFGLLFAIGLVIGQGA